MVDPKDKKTAVSPPGDPEAPPAKLPWIVGFRSFPSMDHVLAYADAAENIPFAFPAEFLVSAESWPDRTQRSVGCRALAEAVHDYLAKRGEFAFDDKRLCMALGLLRIHEFEAATPEERSEARYLLDRALQGLHTPPHLTEGRPATKIAPELDRDAEQIVVELRGLLRAYPRRDDLLASAVIKNWILPQVQADRIVTALRRKKPRYSDAVLLILSSRLGKSQAVTKKLLAASRRLPENVNRRRWASGSGL